MKIKKIMKILVYVPFGTIVLLKDVVLRNQASYEVCGFRLYDKVLWKEQECFISGRTNNRAILRNINWGKVHETPVNLKCLKLVEMRKNYLVFKERYC